MSLLKITHHKVRPPRRPTILCDIVLHDKLSKTALLSNMNKSFFALLLGKPGSGKSTLWVTLLTDRRFYNEVFDRIYIFIPESSLRNIGEESMIHLLPEDRFFHELNVDTLEEVERLTEENAQREWNSLVIFDDVQKDLKGACQEKLIHMIANRRHSYRASFIIAAQTYRKVPRQVRELATDVFAFDPSRGAQKAIEDELLTIDKHGMEQIWRAYKGLKQRRKQFIYFNIDNDKVFIDWDKELNLAFVNGKLEGVNDDKVKKRSTDS